MAFSFLPKEDQYFELFSQMTAKIQEAAGLLVELLEGPDENFDTLSKNIYELIKVSKQETPTYYQFCPMANNGKGANWLSKENVVKNPYYGSMMLSCGKVTETIR